LERLNKKAAAADQTYPVTTFKSHDLRVSNAILSCFFCRAGQGLIVAFVCSDCVPPITPQVCEWLRDKYYSAALCSKRASAVGVESADNRLFRL